MIHYLPHLLAFSNPLYVDLGFTKVQIATVVKVYGIWVAILGAFAGGIVVARYGLFKALLVAGVWRWLS